MTAPENFGPQFADIDTIRGYASADWPGKTMGDMADKPNANRLMNSQRTGDRHTQHAELVADIAANGIRKPLSVSYATDPPTAVDGHHRWYAGLEAGVKSFPVEPFKLRS